MTRRIVKIDVQEILPTREEALWGRGIPEGKNNTYKLDELFSRGQAVFERKVEAMGIIEDISIADFGDVYPGEGRNERSTPLEGIYPQADALALFAGTVGEAVNAEIGELFKCGEFALGYILDGIASAGADKIATYIKRNWLGNLQESGAVNKKAKALIYSPGYCGWHISGQGRLFAHLKPEEIGITLNESYLMRPIKSVSGVIVLGAEKIHQFEDRFPFCDKCLDRSCRDRIASLSGDRV